MRKRRNPACLVTFAEVKDDICEAIIREQSGGLLPELITRLRAEAEIVYF